MELDTNIPLRVQQPQIASPAQTLGEVYKLQSDRNVLKEQDLQISAMEQQNKDRVKSAADEAAIREELKNSQQPDGSYDIKGVMSRLMKNGFGPAAVKFGDAWTEHQTKQTRLAEEQLKQHAAELDMAANMLYGVRDDNTWQVAKRSLTSSKLAPEAAEIVKGIPDDYESAKPFIEHIIAAGSTMKEKLDASYKSLQLHLAAVRNGSQKANPEAGEQEPPGLAKTRLQNEKLETASVAEMLATTKNDQEYQQQIQAFKHQGYSTDVLNKFDTVWSKGAVDKAKGLQISSKDALSMQIRLQELGIREQNRTDRLAARTSLSLAQMYTEYDRDRRAWDKSQPEKWEVYRQGDNIPAGKKVGDWKGEPFQKRDEYLKTHFGVDEQGREADTDEDNDQPSTPPPAALPKPGAPTPPPPKAVAPPPLTPVAPPRPVAVQAPPPAAAAPPPAMPVNTKALTAPTMKVGATIKNRKTGQMVRITKMHPDGSFDAVDAATGKAIPK